MDRLISIAARTTTRRHFAVGMALASTALVLPRTGVIAARQDAELAEAGLPKLDITVLNDGYEGVPENVEAGRYLVTVAIAENQAFGGFGGVAFMRPPEGTTRDELLAAFGIGQQPASPGADGEVLPTTGEATGNGGPPTVIYQAAYAGGTVLEPDGTPGSVVLDLTEGQWIAWADEPSAPQVPSMFTVTGSFPDKVAEPESDISVTMVDFGIEVDGNLVAGDHILKIGNHGAQPHFLLVDRYIGSGTFDNDLMAAVLEAEMAGAEAPEGFEPERDLQNVAISLTQSIGTTSWIEASLEAGTYLAICFFPTAGTGVPHAMVGMHQVFEVSA